MQTQYEKNQKFNLIVSFLHSIRYKYLLDVFADLSSKDKLRTFKIVDIGCAHAKIFDVLNEKFKIAYLGIEPNLEFYEAAKQRHMTYENFQILNEHVENCTANFHDADVILALETLEHIPERTVVDVIHQIALAKPKIFMCSVPNEIGPILWVKNIGSFLTGYMRHKEYTWRETFFAGIYNLDKIAKHETGHKGFDWRWLAQTIRHHIKITKTYSSPIKWLPKIFSFSIIFICLNNQKSDNSSTS